MTYSMSCGGTLIPVTQMIWWEWSLLSSSHCIINPFERWFSLWVQEGKKVSLLPIFIWLLHWDIVPSALRWDVGLLSVLSSGHSPLSNLQWAVPMTQAILQQASIHTASTHCGVNLAYRWMQSARCGQPPNRATSAVPVTTSHGRSSSSAKESVSDWYIRPWWRQLMLHGTWQSATRR